MSRKIILFVLVLMFVHKNSYTQQLIELMPYTGINTNLGNFKNVSTNHFNWGLSGEYTLTPKWSLGIDFSEQMSDFNLPQDFSALSTTITSPYVFTEILNGKWKTNTFGLGPTYHFNIGKLQTAVYTKAGLTFINVPNVQTIFSANGIQKNLFSLDGQRIKTVGINAGVRLNYVFTKNFSLFVNPQFIYTPRTLNYTYADLSSALTTDSEGVESFNLDLLKTTSAHVDLSSLMFNVGVALSFNKANNNNTEDKKPCSAVSLLYPKNQTELFLAEDKRPDFKWKNQSEKEIITYVLKLYDERNEVLYAKRTKHKTLTHSDELESVYNTYFTKEIKPLYWLVETHYQDCPPQTSQKRVIKGGSRNTGLIVNFRNIQCDTMPFDTSGYMHYTGEVYIENPPSNTTSIEIPPQVFTVTNVSNTASAPVTYTPFSPLFPIILAPSNSTVITFKFSRPIGETQSTLHVLYHEVGFPSLITEELSVDSLPNCVCDVCETWELKNIFKNLWKTNNANFNMKLKGTLKIKYAKPIKEVKAEIVHFKHQVNNPECYTCTKQDNNMALFHKGKVSGTNWEDNFATLNDEDNDGYSNQMVWKANTGGVSFSTQKVFLIDLNFPENNTLSCCRSTYNICIRYTFTTIDCETCDYLVCYKYNPLKNGTGSVESISQEPNQNIKETY